MSRVFLVDGNSYVYRAFFATPYLSNSKGTPTNAIYAFVNMIRKLINEQKPDYMMVVWDSKAPSFRAQISQEYKATRPPMPGNLSLQFPYVKAIVEKMGIATIEKEGFEADDVIATLVRRLAAGPDAELYVVTSDKDLMQLVGENVTIIDTMKNAVMKRAEVAEKFGIEPSLISDFLALSGDTSDNIPGVPGIGEKTARELICAFGGVEAIYASLDAIKKPSVRQKLAENRERADLSRQLATLRFDVPVDVGLEDMRIREPDPAELRQLFRELEFTSLVKEIKVEDASQPLVQAASLGDVLGGTVSLVARIEGRCPYDVTLQGMAVSNGRGVFSSQRAEDLFSAVNGAKEVVVHNLKPLFLAATKRGIDLTPSFFDTMLAVYLINPGRKDFAIDGILNEFLGRDAGGADGDALARSALHLGELRDALAERLDALGLRRLFDEIEMPLVEVLARMECFGVRVDRSALAALSRDFDSRLNTIVSRIYGEAGETFNINSPQQLVRILFEKLNLPPVKKTKKSLSTDNEVLQTLSDLHPLPAQILEYRSLAKLKSTYVDNLPGLIHASTGRIHASFNQMVVATGRLSSSDPNLQNIPIKGVEGRKIRAAFVPEEGFLIVSSDYSQIELRVLAHVSGDELLVEAFQNDLDIHSRVAQEVFRVDAEHVTPAMRRTAKVINFGIVYGISGYGLSKELGVGPKEAQAYIDAYFERHKGIKAYIESTLEEARAAGLVRTLFGRIRYIPELSNADSNVRQFGERTAANTPIQGTAADIIKKAMVAIYRRMKERKLRSRLIMQIHDELVFEVASGEEEEMEALVRQGMEHACELSVPLKVTVGKGRNWAEAHD